MTILVLTTPTESFHWRVKDSADEISFGISGGDGLWITDTDGDLIYVGAKVIATSVIQLKELEQSKPLTDGEELSLRTDLAGK